MTAIPIGEYAAVTLLLFFGIKAIKDAWELPSKVDKGGDKGSPELDEFVEAEELVKEKVGLNELPFYQFVLINKKYIIASIL